MSGYLEKTIICFSLQASWDKDLCHRSHLGILGTLLFNSIMYQKQGEPVAEEDAGWPQELPDADTARA